jgi:pimeloyl-ACP methyl ester carboxylesterase
MKDDTFLLVVVWFSGDKSWPLGNLTSMPNQIRHQLTIPSQLHAQTVAAQHIGNDGPGSEMLVWMPGLGAAGSAFEQVASRPELAGLASLLVDLPGSGASPPLEDWNGTIEDHAAVALAFVEQVAQKPVVLFGHSLGGSVAIVAATHRPDLIRHLIVAEPNLDPGSGTTSVTIARQREADFVAVGFRRLLAATERLARQGNTSADRWLATLRQSDPLSLHRAATSLLANRTPTFREQLATLAVPVSTIRGDLSQLPRPPVTASTHLRRYVVPNAGHQMFDDNPAAFSAILAAIIFQASH